MTDLPPLGTGLKGFVPHPYCSLPTTTEFGSFQQDLKGTLKFCSEEVIDSMNNTPKSFSPEPTGCQVPEIHGLLLCCVPQILMGLDITRGQD